MAKYNPARRGLDEQELEGGGAGASMRSTSTKSTKWSGMPSMKGNASLMDDLKKITAPPTKAKGAAKRSVELATDRAVSRTLARAAGAGAAGAGVKAMTSKEAAAAKDKDDYEDMSGDVAVDPSNPTGVAGKGMKKGGMTASRRADGIAARGKTKGRIV
jgi:hypothetical protein